MSYTNGGQTIDKSMNGLIVFDTGGGVVIEGDDITADGTITCNDLNVTGLGTFTNLPTSPATTSDTLFQLINRTVGNIFYSRLASPNIFTSTNSFNNFLPTSTIIDTLDLSAFINRTIANIYYARLSAGNIFTSTNSFNNFLPTSTITDTSDLFAFINRTIANVYYSRLATDNNFLGNNKFTQLSTDSTISLNQNISGPTINPPLRITSTGSSNTLNFNANTTGYNGLITSGDSAIYTSPINSNALTLTSHANGSVGVRITPTDVRIVGTTTSLDGTSTNITGACAFTSLPTCSATTTTTNSELINKTIGNAVYSQLGTTNTFTSLTTFQGGIDVTGTTANIRPTGTLNMGDTSVTTAVNLGNQVNTVTNNIFGQTINLGDDVNATINLLSRTVNMGDVFGGTTAIKSPNINLGSGSFGGTVTVGLDNVSHITNIISRAITVGTTRAGTTTTISSPSVSVTGDCAFTALPTCTVTTTADNTALINKNIGNEVYARLTAVNTFTSSQTITPTGSFACQGGANFTGSQSVNFTQLPTSNVTTATMGQMFITKNIGDSLYPQLGSANTYTGQNDFNGVVIIKNSQTTADPTTALSIQNSATNVNSINFGTQLAGGNYNPAMVSGDSGIFAGKSISGTYGTAVLNLTAHSNNKSSVRIDGLGTVNIEALTNNLNADTTNITGECFFTKPRTATYSSIPSLIPTFTSLNQIGFTETRTVPLSLSSTGTTPFFVHSFAQRTINGVFLMDFQVTIDATANTRYSVAMGDGANQFSQIAKSRVSAFTAIATNPYYLKSTITYQNIANPYTIYAVFQGSNTGANTLTAAIFSMTRIA